MNAPTPRSIRRNPTTWALGALVLASSVACRIPVVVVDDFGDEQAGVSNTTDATIWLGSARTDIGPSFLVVEPNDEAHDCVKDPGSIRVFVREPRQADDTDFVFSLDVGEQDFCDGTYTWDGEVLVREK